MSVPLVAFIGELHGSDDSVLQLIRGFIQVCASMMCGGVHVCLAI